MTMELREETQTEMSSALAAGEASRAKLLLDKLRWKSLFCGLCLYQSDWQ